MRWRHEQGDTIIEVLLAITVFSLLAVGAMVVMNQGTSMTQRSLEMSLVKQQINAQAEALRAAYDENLALKASGRTSPTPTAWQSIVGKADMTSLAVTNRCPSNYGSAFVINGRTASGAISSSITSMDDATAPPYAQLSYSGALKSYGIWIEKSTSTNFNPQVYTFRVRACWYGPGNAVPMQLQTVVRLYEV